MGRPPSCAPSPVQEKLKPAFLEELPKKLQELSRFLGSRPWFAGQKVGGGCWGGFGGSLWGLTPPVPSPAHLRGFPGVRCAGPAAHVRARVPRAEGKPGPVPAALRGEQGRGQPGATLMSPYPTPAVPVTIPDTSVCPCPIPSLIHESPVVLSPSPFLSPHNPIPDPLVSQSLSPTPWCPHH